LATNKIYILFHCFITFIEPRGASHGGRNQPPPQFQADIQHTKTSEYYSPRHPTNPIAPTLAPALPTAPSSPTAPTAPIAFSAPSFTHLKLVPRVADSPAPTTTFTLYALSLPWKAAHIRWGGRGQTGTGSAQIWNRIRFCRGGAAGRLKSWVLAHNDPPPHNRAPT
jgi:hypothetical protein